MAQIKTVGVVGAGQMGSGIAHVCAVAGYDVVLNDISAERVDAGVATIKRYLDRQVAKGTIEQAAVDAALARIKPAVDYADFKDADIVVEAATETEEIKKTIFRDVCPHLKPSALLASNT